MLAQARSQYICQVQVRGAKVSGIQHATRVRAAMHPARLLCESAKVDEAFADPGSNMGYLVPGFAIVRWSFVVSRCRWGDVYHEASASTP